MLRRMAGLPKGRRSLSSTVTKPANMGSLMVDPPSPSTVPISVKAAQNGDITSHRSQRNTHTHAALRFPSPTSVISFYHLLLLPNLLPVPTSTRPSQPLSASTFRHMV
jgi:hypothetical protein